MVTLTVNGQKHELEAKRTVRDLVVDLGLGDAAVAVELNDQVVPHSQHDTTTLNEADVLEVVTLVGGG